MKGLQSAGQIKDPACAGSYTGGMSSDAPSTLLSLEALSFAALVRQAQRAQMKDKSYRATPVGGEVGRFLRALRWADKSENTLDTYEDRARPARLRPRPLPGPGRVHDRDAARLPRRPLGRCVAGDPAATGSRSSRASSAGPSTSADWGGTRPTGSNPPEGNSVERQAYAPDVIEQPPPRPTDAARPDLHPAARVGSALRTNELRLLQVGDFDLGQGHRASSTARAARSS